MGLCPCRNVLAKSMSLVGGAGKLGVAPASNVRLVSWVAGAHQYLRLPRRSERCQSTTSKLYFIIAAFSAFEFARPRAIVDYQHFRAAIFDGLLSMREARPEQERAMKRAKYLSACAFAMLALASTGANAATNLIVNGSFETGDFTGWTPAANSYPIYIVTGPVEAGVYAAQIAGFQRDPNTLSQTITTTTAGQSYELSFWRYQADGAPPIGLTVTWDGVTVLSETNPGAQPYQNFTADVVGTGLDTLVFTSYNDPSFTYLDNVSLTALATPTPEAGKGVLALAMLVVAGALVRARGLVA
jgi:hypothetical protein